MYPEKKLAIIKHQVSINFFIAPDNFSKKSVIRICPPSTNVYANAKKDAAAIQ